MKSLKIASALLVILTLTTSAGLGQEMPQFPSAKKEHEWLKKFVGEWTFESEGTMGPGQPLLKCTGSMSSRMLGELWVISDTTAHMPMAEVQAIQTIGYDPVKKEYVGTWVDSMMNHLWHYHGSVDESGRKLTLEAEGPNFMVQGKLTKFRDAYEFETPDHIIATSSMLNDNGEWVTFMTGHFRRKK